MDLGTHLVLVSGGLNIVARHSGGANRTWLNSCWPYKTWYADSWGWVRDVWSILSVSCAFLINLHNSISGNVSSYVLRPTIV